MSEIRFLVNPAGGRGRVRRALPRLRELAARAGAVLEESRSAAHLSALAARAAAEGARRVLVAGGDGTVNRAVQALAGTDTALGVVPLGSGNDLAASLGVPQDPAAAVARALTAPVRRIDLGRAEGRCFAGVAGAGFDSVVTDFANRGIRWLKGSPVYLYAVLHTLATFCPPRARVAWEGGSFEGRIMLAVLANTPRFGGGMRVAPGARLDDGLLDLVLVKAVSRSTFLRIFPRVYRGRHLTHPAVLTASTPWAHLSLAPPIPVYGDGEPLVPMPRAGVRFEVVPGGLLVV